MPHQCVRCGEMYEDGSQDILKGCTCGAKMFFFVKKKDLEKSRQIVQQLSEEERHSMEKDVYEIIGIEPEDTPVVLDIEAVRVVKPGKYELDLVHLFKGDPLIIKLDEGKYVIDLPKAFQKKEE